MAFDSGESDGSYDGRPSLDPSTTSRKRMTLRDTSRIRRPLRYRDDLEPIDPGRPIFVHEDPVFNMDRAQFVPWKTLELDQPSPGEAQYNLWKEQGEPRDAFGDPVTPSRSQAQIAESPGPTVAHLRRQSTAVRRDLSEPIADSVEHRDEFDDAFEANLANFESDDDEPVVLHPPLSSKYQDWSALSDNVQWAIIYDLANDHADGITAAANLLGLTLPDVIKFVNTYVYEKTMWESGSSQDETPYPAAKDLFRGDCVQDEANQPPPETDVHRPVLGDEAFKMIIDGGNDPLEGISDIWNEPEVELFLEPEVYVSSTAQSAQADSEGNDGQLDPQTVVDQPGIAEKEERPEVGTRPALVELITDSFSREDISSGRSFLTFVGLQEYADRFGQWFGRGNDFREIPGIFDEDNDFVFSTAEVEKALYRGNELAWSGPLPRLDQNPVRREWLMDALPQSPAPNEKPGDHEYEEFHASAERINGRRINLDDTDDSPFGYISEGAYGGLRYDEFDLTGANAEILAYPRADEKEVETLDQGEGDGRLDSNIYQLNHNIQGAGGNMALGTLGDISDNGALLFNTSSIMQHCPYMPRFDNGIPDRLLELGHININEGYTPQQLAPPSLAPPWLQLREGIAQEAVEAAPAFDLASNDNNSHVESSDQALQGRARSPWSSKASLTIPQSTEMPQNAAEQIMADTSNAELTTGEATNDATVPSTQGPADAGKFADNGIEIEKFPKCYTCFQTRSRCDRGRPCRSCLNRNRTCKDVTKAILDDNPERAERVLKDKARLDRRAAEAEGRSIVLATAPMPNAGVSTLAIPHSATSGVKRKQPAVNADSSTDEEDPELDEFPQEKDDPEDDDYGDAPKKKKKAPKKGSTPAGKKQGASQAKMGVSATSTPTKKRAPAKKTNETSAAGRRPDESAFAGNTAMAVPKQSASTDGPAASKQKSSSLSRSAGRGSLVGPGAGRSVNTAAEVVGHTGGQSGVQNVRPVTGGKPGATPNLAEKMSAGDRHLVPPIPSSGAGQYKYLDISFAPYGTQPGRPTDRPEVLGMPVTPMMGSVAGLPDPAFHTSPSRGAPSMQHARGRFTPSHPRMALAQQGMIPVTAGGMPLVPQVAYPPSRPTGSYGTMKTSSPTSQSSSSGTTVSMDFARVSSSPIRGVPVRSDLSVAGRFQHDGSGRQGMLDSSPNAPTGMVPGQSPTAPQRSRFVSTSHPQTGVSSPMMATSPLSAMAYGPGSSYNMFQQQAPVPYPFLGLPQGPAFPVPPQMLPFSTPPGVIHGAQGEMVRPGPRRVDVSPTDQRDSTASPRSAKRRAEAPSTPGQRPAGKKSRASESPLAPPKEAGSWKELAISQWTADSQESQPEPAKVSVKPVFGGDGPIDVTFSTFTRIREQINPQLQQAAMETVRKINRSATGTNEKKR
ncbi:hypothetical protein Daus18300_009764 [Diaporthe australafricana]|uniref:Zn(2)-C6 fungal-type domain-containing protein n=1 Tax=Diaporthe australafricana TaxID=127596 RepID=A0ABR3WD97_9PEZI